LCSVFALKIRLERWGSEVGLECHRPECGRRKMVRGSWSHKSKYSRFWKSVQDREGYTFYPRMGGQPKRENGERKGKRSTWTQNLVQRRKVMMKKVGKETTRKAKKSNTGKKLPCGRPSDKSIESTRGLEDRTENGGERWQRESEGGRRSEKALVSARKNGRSQWIKRKVE